MTFQHQTPAGLSRTEARIDEALERRAFPELEPVETPVSETQYVIWRHADTIRAIDEAEPLWRAGHSGHGWEGLKLGILAGRTPDEARAAARARFEREYGAAVAAEVAHG